MAFAQVHRFRDRVAVYVGEGKKGAKTSYLTAKEARKLARALNAAARSVDREPFTESTCGTVEFQLSGDQS